MWQFGKCCSMRLRGNLAVLSSISVFATKLEDTIPMDNREQRKKTMQPHRQGIPDELPCSGHLHSYIKPFAPEAGSMIKADLVFCFSKCPDSRTELRNCAPLHPTGRSILAGKSYFRFASSLQIRGGCNLRFSEPIKST